MADWIHCNKCFVRYCRFIKIYISSCGHLVCDKCASKTDANQCSICKSDCTLIILDNNIKPEIKMLFHSQSEIIHQTYQACMFQDINKSMLLKNVTDKYLATKLKLRKCYKELQDTEKEKAKLKAILKNFTGHTFSPITSLSGYTIPSQLVDSSNYSNASKPKQSTSFMYPLNQRSHTSLNSTNTPQIVHQQHPNPYCYQTPK